MKSESVESKVQSNVSTLKTYLMWITNRMAECNLYSWSDDYKIKSSKESWDKFYKEIKDENLIDSDFIKDLLPTDAFDNALS